MKMRIPHACLALLALMCTGQALAVSEADLLRPEEAFRYEVSADADALTVALDIADGYYLYRKRFAFESLTDGVTLGEPAFPEGELHEDEFFGESVIFRDRADIRIPYSRSGGADAAAELRFKMQGCADIGLCYPPQTLTAAVELPAPAAASAASNLLAALEDDSDAYGGFLPVDEAFRLTAQPVSRDWVDFTWAIAEGYYLYRHRLSFAAADAGATLGEPLIPDGERKTDEFFGEVEVYHDLLSVRVPVQSAADRVTIEVGYQGCAEGGICYPPEKRSLTVELADAGMASATDDRFPGAGGPVSEQDRLAGLIRDGGLPWVIATFFGFGLLLAFTPCVLPMVPILSSVIVGPGRELGVPRAFALSLAFVLAMSLTYTIAGVVVALLGQNLQAVFQHPAILIAFAAVFVGLALSMFGVYELQVPAALQTKLSAISQRQEGGTLIGAAVMGVLSALIVGPCVAAPLAATLIVIGQSGDVVRGGLTLFALSLGMGTPLLAFGASAGKLLPKAGPWMNVVKAAFGVLLLGVAIWMVERILPPAVSMFLWAALFLGAGLALIRGAGGMTGGRGALRIGGLALAAWGALIAVGGATGAQDPVRPLAGSALRGEPVAKAEFTLVKTTAELDEALAGAAATGRPAMLDFYADWCVDCKKMDRYTFTEPAVIAALDGMLLLKADVTANDEADQALLRRFGIFGPPTIAFFDADGREMRGLRQVGFAPAEEFSVRVAAAREAANR
jgi:thiol:disulfide interchange protein DsbD